MKKLTPLQAIRKRCLSCVETTTQIRECEFNGQDEEMCTLYPFRMGKGRARIGHIREYCLVCCNGSKQEVKLCPVEKCPLWGYRLGNRPIYTPDCPES